MTVLTLIRDQWPHTCGGRSLVEWVVTISQDKYHREMDRRAMGTWERVSLVVEDWRQLSGEVELTYDNWRQADVRADENCFFFIFLAGVHFLKKNRKKNFFSLKTGPLGGSRGRVYAYHTPLLGCTVKTNIQTVDSVYSKTIHQDMEEDHNTKSARDTGVEKHSCQIELRGAHVNLVYYNNKRVLRVYTMLHVTVVPHVRSRDEHTDTYTYMLRWYIRIYIHTSIYIYIYEHTHTHKYC